MMLKKLTALFTAIIMLALLAAGCSADTGLADAVKDQLFSTDSDNTDESENGQETDSADGEVPYYSKGLTAEGFFEGVTASEVVSLPEYKGISIPATLLEADNEEVQEQIDLILSEYETYERVMDRAIEDGDTVNIDYVGSVDGVEFSGGSTQGLGTDVTIGVTQYIDDFLEQLIGHMPGENFDIEVTFPDPYTVNPDMSGKDAVFNITINYIQGDLVEAELTDDIAADYGFQSVDELIEDIEAWLIEEQQAEFVEELLQNTICEEIPESVYEHFKEYMLSTYEEYALTYYGVDLDTFLGYMEYESQDVFIQENEATLNSMAVHYLAAQAVAEIEGIAVTAQDIEDAGFTGYEAIYGMPYLYQYVLVEMLVPQFIIENAVFE